jgi:hypothetical protein
MKLALTSKIFALVFIASLTGCAQQYEWVSKTKSAGSFNSDRYKCVQQSAKTYPAIMQQVSYGTGMQTPTQTTCIGAGSNVSCTTTMGQYTPPPSSFIDVNEGNRTQAYNACMTANGWELREIVKGVK